LDVTDTSATTSRILGITAKPQSVNSITLEYDPQNEGEEAIYTFKFFPSSIIVETVTQIII